MLAADLFILLVKVNRDIKRLELLSGMELKVLAVVNDSQIVFIITVVFLNGCVWVITVFCQISGMVINWNKTVVICSSVFIFKFSGLFEYVCVLQFGEIQKYLGVEYEASGEDRCIGFQFVFKVRKRCQQVQLSYYFLVVRVVLLNFI